MHTSRGFAALGLLIALLITAVVGGGAWYYTSLNPAAIETLATSTPQTATTSPEAVTPPHSNTPMNQSTETVMMVGIFKGYDSAFTADNKKYLTAFIETASGALVLDLRPLIGYQLSDASAKLGIAIGDTVIVTGVSSGPGLLEASKIAKAAGGQGSNPIPLTINYGSRVGMEVTVVSAQGLDSANALIRTVHARENAIAYCEGYLVQRPATEECIQDELAQKLVLDIRADCTTGEFNDFYGGRYQFLGANPHPDQSDPSVAKYQIKDLSNGEIIANSGASGYTNKFFIFKALCPSEAPSEPF